LQNLHGWLYYRLAGPVANSDGQGRKVTGGVPPPDPPPTVLYRSRLHLEDRKTRCRYGKIPIKYFYYGLSSKRRCLPNEASTCTPPIREKTKDFYQLMVPLPTPSLPYMCCPALPTAHLPHPSPEPVAIATVSLRSYVTSVSEELCMIPTFVLE